MLLEFVNCFVSERTTMPFAWTTIATVCVVSYLLALATATHVPVPPDVVLPEGSDKTIHLIVYWGAGAIAAWRVWLAGAGRWSLLLLALSLIVFAALDELTQTWVGRTCDFADWCYDSVGVVLGIVSWLLGVRLWQRRASV